MTTLELVGLLVVTAFVLSALVGGVFGALVLGDHVGLWHFDSGLGCEAGDSSCVKGPAR